MLSHAVWRAQSTVMRDSWNDDPDERDPSKVCGNRAGGLPDPIGAGPSRRVVPTTSTATRCRRTTRRVFGRLRTGVERRTGAVGARGPEPVGEGSAGPRPRPAASSRCATTTSPRRREPAATAGYRHRTRVLVTCVNVANRPRPRDRPGPGVRDPRGARLQPRPLARQLVIESLVLAGLVHHRVRAGGDTASTSSERSAAMPTAARLGRLQRGRAPLGRGGDNRNCAGV